MEDIVHNNNAIFERVRKWENYLILRIENRKYKQNVIFTEVIVFNKCLTVTFQSEQWT